MAHIQLDGVNLAFRVHCGRTTVKEFLLRRLFRRKTAGQGHSVMSVEALKDLTFQVHEGERVGVIGGNGAGKSTLLRVLAGIYPPTSGRLQVEGKISSLFDINLGFEWEASGWENICYRGYLQGETPASIKDKVKPIAEFSELGHFLDMPVRYYSSGMKVRLAFSIATAIDPEILLVDEVLSVGDRAFMEKAGQRICDVMNKARLIVMVSHDLDAIKKICHRVLWLDHGRIRMAGDPEAVVEAYKDSVAAPQSAAA
jgi:ABC-type polysaccharide/polyol phosphate transport system ATPase subunit